MNRLFLFSALALLFTACKKDQVSENKLDDTFNDDNWLRLRIPSGGELKAVAGSIDDTLVVSTLYDTYIVTENGTKYLRTTKNLNHTPGLLMQKDTVFALSGLGIDVKMNRRYASIPTYFTLDKGLTWHNAIDHSKLAPMLLGVVTSRNHTTYELNYHSGPDNNGNGSNYVLRTTISKMENGITSQFDHPVKEQQPINLYLDDKERMYIATGGSISDANVYIGASVTEAAYLYISKQPIK